MSEKLSETAALYIAHSLEAAIARVEETMRLSSQHVTNKSLGQPARDYFEAQEAEHIKVAAEIKAVRKSIVRGAL